MAPTLCVRGPNLGTIGDGQRLSSQVSISPCGKRALLGPGCEAALRTCAASFLLIPSGRGSEVVSIACHLESLRPPSQLIQHVLGAGLQIHNVLKLFAVLPHCHEVGTLDVNSVADR